VNVSSPQTEPPQTSSFLPTTSRRYDSRMNLFEWHGQPDVVSEAELPFRRLVFAGANGDEWFIHYERGGRGHSYSVIVFKIYAPYRLRFLWGGAGFRAAANLQELQKMVAAGHFADDGRVFLVSSCCENPITFITPLAFASQMVQKDNVRESLLPSVEPLL